MLCMAGSAACGSLRRASLKYFISPAYPRESHSCCLDSSGNFSARTTPAIAKPSRVARSEIQVVAETFAMGLLSSRLIRCGCEYEHKERAKTYYIDAKRGLGGFFVEAA